MYFYSKYCTKQRKLPFKCLFCGLNYGEGPRVEVRILLPQTSPCHTELSLPTKTGLCNVIIGYYVTQS